MGSIIPGAVATTLEFMVTLFVFVVGLGAAVVVVIFILDVSQTKDAIRRNFPVVGRFRDLFITLGEFFRQYFFAMDREEMPFNRAERTWVNRAARERGQYRRIRLDHEPVARRQRDLRQLSVSDTGDRSRRHRAAAHRPLLPRTLCRAVVLQHLGHELRFAVATGDPGALQGRGARQVLAQYR